MIQRSIRLMWRGAVVLAFLVYVALLRPLGERSAFGHLMRVVKTDEAQELGREVSVATQRIAQADREPGQRGEPAAAVDAGASAGPRSSPRTASGNRRPLHTRAKSTSSRDRESSSRTLVRVQGHSS